MLTLKGSRHIRTSHHLKGCRALATRMGFSPAAREARRRAWEKERLAARQAYRLWLAEQWNCHFAWAAGPCRVLPPGARARLHPRFTWNMPRRSWPS
jgi:hypothetical protein